MPPKGRKKIVAGAKSNGVSKTVQVDEMPTGSLKSRSGRPRKMAVKEEAIESEPILDKEASEKENGSIKEVGAEETSDISKENVNGKVEKPEEKPSAPTKQEEKVDNEESTEEVESKNSKEGELPDEPASDVEIEPEVKAPPKRGRKKAAEQIPKEEIKTDEPEKLPAKRGRKKATNQMFDQKKESDEVVETVAKAEPEKLVGKRGRKKAEEPAPTKHDEAEESESTQEVIEVPAKAGPSKRPRIIEVDLAHSEDKEEDDFAPRKTRGAKNVKEVVAPVPRGRKRKGTDDKAEGKYPKKGKELEDVAANQLMRVRIEIERDAELDERAKNTLKEDEAMLEENEEGVNAASGKAKSGRKRANNKKDDGAKPAKAKKEDAPEKKSGSKKDQIPDVTALDFGNDSKSPDGKPWNFKVASWNVSGLRAWIEKNGLSYLHHEKPDILCLQETKCSDAKLPAEVEDIEGYHCHWLAGEKEGYSGVAILSKEKPISIKDGIGIEEHDNEGRVITAEYEKFYLVTAYVPNAGRGLPRLDYRMQWDKDFREYLKELDKKKPVILCGDLNVAHEEIDLANPKSNKKNAGFTQEERDGFSDLLKEGFVDTFRHLYPDTKAAYTFWTYMMNARAKNAGWRLDYFVISERFTDHLCDNVIRKDVFGSDHCPIGLLLHV